MTKSRKYTIPLGILLIYFISVLGIHFSAPDRVIEPDDFPEKCPDNSLNCSIISSNSHRSEGLTEIRLNSSLEEVMQEANTWINSQPRTEIIGNWFPEHTHSVFRSFTFRFPDDFVVRGYCDTGQTVLEVYSKSRLGISDIGVNSQRVMDFTKHIIAVEMPTSECVTG